MSASNRPPNLLLQMLAPADFNLLAPHLSTIEMVKEAVLNKKGDPLTHVYFPHGGAGSVDRRKTECHPIVASALQRAGTIRYSRGQIEITDGHALRHASCECYFAIETQREQLLGIGS